jgi:RNA polymerase sigma factor (TIGR02999 family)
MKSLSHMIWPLRSDERLLGCWFPAVSAGAVMSDVTELLRRASSNDRSAIDELFALLYNDVRRMAHGRLIGGAPISLLNTTAVANEAYLRLCKAERLDITSRAHFMAYLSKVLRAVIVDFARRRSAERRGGAAQFVTLDTAIGDSVAAADAEVERLDDALAVLQRNDPRLKQIVEMRYFAGMSDAEIAEALGVTPRTVGRDWVRARLLLSVEMKTGDV